MIEQEKRRRYSEAFKRRAVAALMQSGKSAVEVSEQMGVERSVLQKWKKKFSADLCTGPCDEKGAHQTARELAKLRNEILSIKETVEYLRNVIKKSYTDKYNGNQEP